MIHGLVFDFDGLILDTESPDFESWQECFREHGCELSIDVWGAVVGRAAGAFDIYGHLEALAGRPVDRDAVRPSRRQRYLTMVEAQAILPGIEAYLADARRLGLKLGVASSGTREWVAGHLERLGLHVHFDTVRCREDVPRAKPDPDLYLAALADLGLDAREAVALEDSPNGVLAAKRAGLFCVAVPNPLTARLSLDHADLVVPSLADLPLARLLAIATRRG